MDRLTYEHLFDTLRREKSRDELQVPEPGFYALARQFLAEKQGTIREAAPGTMAAQRAQIEYQNAQRILRELYDRRERKIVTLAMHKTRTESAVVDSEALLPEERAFFDTLVRLLQGIREQILSKAPIPERAPPEKPAEPQRAPEKQSTGEDTVQVKFLSTVPKFVGKDLQVFGPYESGSTAALPSSVARILIDKKRAEPLGVQVSTS